MTLRVKALHAEEARSRTLSALEEVRWTLAEQLAAAVDSARMDQNARDVMAAASALEEQLEKLAAPAAPDDRGAPDPRAVYDSPPTMGHAPDS